MPPIICSYNEITIPNGKISLKEGNTQQILSLLKGGKIDFGFNEGIVNDSGNHKRGDWNRRTCIVTADRGLNRELFIDTIQDEKWF